MTKNLIAGDPNANLAVYAEALLLHLWDVPDFLHGLDDPNLRLAFKKEFKEGTIPKRGVRRSMLRTLEALQAIGSGITAFAIGAAVAAQYGLIFGTILAVAIIISAAVWILRTLTDVSEQLEVEPGPVEPTAPVPPTRQNPSP